MTFGERLRELRLENNLRQYELGELLFVSPRVISYYETDERFPNDAATLIRIAKFFNVSLDYLLGMSDVRKSNPLASFELTPDLMQLIQSYNAANERGKGRILQLAIDLSESSLQ